MENKQIKKQYQNDDVTVLWQPALCIHSEKCFKGLPQVFNPNKKTWVNIDGATPQQIIDQVRKCPSGALSIPGDQLDHNKNQNTKIDLMENGPMMVHGPVEITDHTGDSRLVGNKVTAFCRCGASERKPFCDGSHKKVGFKG